MSLKIRAAFAMLTLAVLGSMILSANCVEVYAQSLSLPAQNSLSPASPGNNQVLMIFGAVLSVLLLLTSLAGYLWVRQLSRPINLAQTILSQALSSPARMTSLNRAQYLQALMLTLAPAGPIQNDSRPLSPLHEKIKEQLAAGAFQPQQEPQPEPEQNLISQTINAVDFITDTLKDVYALDQRTLRAPANSGSYRQ